MVQRILQEKAVNLAKKFPFVVITGPRQSGKTTLTKMAFPDYRRVSLEDMDNRAFAQEDPRGFIATYSDRTIIDEVQRVPHLLSYLQTHCDDEGKEGMYILTGSQNMELMESVDQSLSGRVGLLHLLPFSKTEMKESGFWNQNIDNMLLQGSYPRLYDKGIAPCDYYPSYINTYIERDVRRIKNITELSKFERFLKMCAARIGQLLNMSSLANDCGISVPTVEQWISVLEASYILFRLKPDFKNYSKRLVKTPKLYFYDTGLACSLLDIKTETQMNTHYLRGNLFENLVVSDFIKDEFNNGAIETALSFWRDSRGNEVDIIKRIGEEEFAYEIKSAATFNESFTKGLDYWAKLSNADSAHKTVLYGGTGEMLRSNAMIQPFMK
ncbi:MAG: ATP-binding protein [Bacteroidales bacterium]|nr:ATP-binding protein [Candidatus Egerieousia equi]